MGCGGRSWSGSSSPRSCKPGCGVHPQRPRNESFLFADLAGYTALTEAHGDEHAADAAADFCASVRTLLEEHGAEEVKAIGDAMLLRVDDPDQAVRLAARIVTGYGARRRTLGIRVGVHTGTAVRRGGDWFGSAVNLASRVADLAGSGEVLLTDATRQALGALAVRELGPRKFKNVAEPLRVYSLALEHDAARLPVDPVCHMAVDPPRAAARQDSRRRRVLHLLTRIRTRLRSRSRPLHQHRLIPDPRPIGSSRQRPDPTRICAATSASDAPVRSGPRVLLSRRNCSALP
jgi:adenylate cyclase